MNKNIAGRTINEWREDNIEYIKEYYENNKEDIKEQKKQYYAINKEDIKEQKKQYYENNKEHKKQYYENNKDRIAHRNAKKIKCECGCDVTRNQLTRHQRTKKHIELMNKLN